MIFISIPCQVPAFALSHEAKDMREQAFIDEVLIWARAGNGGSGRVSFRREKYVPKGGPDGGDGGAGGSIRFRASSRKRTLLEFRRRRKVAAKNGQPGDGGNRTGKSGQDIIIDVPLGTLIREEGTDQVLADLCLDGQEALLCKGGQGGKGNSHFATSTLQAPRFAKPGEEGEVRHLRLELQLLADTGLIGLPNAGKSTFLSCVTRARPKIASYPFTTLTPKLGVARIKDKEIVLADIPGLIEGASHGVGLGFQFLKHIRRSHILGHLLSLEPFLEEEEMSIAAEKVRRNYDQVQEELGNYDPELLTRVEVIACTKLDLVSKELRQEVFHSLEKAFSGKKILYISSHTQEGCDALLSTLVDALPTPQEEAIASPEQKKWDPIHGFL